MAVRNFNLKSERFDMLAPITKNCSTNGNHDNNNNNKRLQKSWRQQQQQQEGEEEEQQYQQRQEQKWQSFWFSFEGFYKWGLSLPHDYAIGLKLITHFCYT